jgi:hypothetical protein
MRSSTRSISPASRVKPTFKASSSTMGNNAADASLHRMGPSKPAASR